MSLKQTEKPGFRGGLVLRLLLCVALLTLPLASVGCNNYPLNLLTAIPYTEITDSLAQKDNKAVDILFVIDNSGSMKEEQEKLKANFSAFINALVNEDVGNYQIGIITTDMDDVTQSGKLQSNNGAPRIISRANSSSTDVTKFFNQNSSVGITGTSYEKPLDAMRAALSPTLLNDENANKGFLREGALLAIIFVTDENDCSHDGSIRETELDSEVCRRPNSFILKDENGNPLPDANGNPVRGEMEKLIPTKTYIDFLKGLNRDVLVAGLIGNPVVYRDPATKTKIDPQGGCKQDIECSSPSGSPHKCEYITLDTFQCGGCKSTDANAIPGFRVYDVIKEFGGTDNWFPICGDNEGFKQALLNFAGLIINKLNFVVLTREPSDPNSLTVTINVNDRVIPVPKAPILPTPATCSTDADCASTANSVCGGDQRCYGDGWVYFKTDGQHRLKLSGKSKKSATSGTKIDVSYPAKTQTSN